MCKQGSEPDLNDALIWVIPHESFWSSQRNNANTGYYSRTPFSVYCEKRQDATATLDYAIQKWKPKPYGLIRLIYSDVKAAGYKAVFEEEDGNPFHLNVSLDPNPKDEIAELSKRAKTQMLCDASVVVRPWGRPLEGDVSLID